jgi:phosphopantothenoylcysteine decarboxylase/phosphopantothenate--cysteine ligase
LTDPRPDILGSHGAELAQRRIGFCITGSVAAVKAPEIARELMRHGASVVPIMSDGAQTMIQPELMRWASQNDPITTITGRLEHIRLTQEKSAARLDLLLISPATANTLGKIASGVSDTPVTLIASCALGAGLPVVAAPSMHNSIWANPTVQSNLEQLRSMDVEILPPLMSEGISKMSAVSNIIEAVIRRLYPKDLDGLRVMVTAGPTYEHIDPVRLITNRSSGKMGFAMAREASRRGAAVTLVSGPSLLAPPLNIDLIPVETAQEMAEMVADRLKESKFDVMFAAAAPSDFQPIKPAVEKISSKMEAPFDLKVKPTEKVIRRAKKVQPDIFLVAFKAEWGANRDEMIARAKLFLKEADADMVAVNNVTIRGIGFGADTNQILLVKKDGRTINIHLALKQTVARHIIDKYLLNLPKTTRLKQSHHAPKV